MPSARPRDDIAAPPGGLPSGTGPGTGPSTGPSTGPRTGPRTGAGTPRRFVFLLLRHFTMLSLAGAIEPLRLANRVAGRTLYDWQLASEDGPDGPGVACSNGIVLRPDIGLEALSREDGILVCGGLDVASATSRPVVAWLRREARRGAMMAGLCTGAHALARAGLLDGRRATIHWEVQDVFSEQFPEVRIARSVFVMDGNRWTTAGGTAAIDLLLRVITQDHGADLAAEVADQMIHGATRTDVAPAPQAAVARIGGRHPRLGLVIQAMEEHLEDPLSPAELAVAAGISTRQLERLFRRHMNRSPKRYYMELRLQKARNLLTQTNMSVINVALACGFASPSHFAKCYRAQFALTPYRERGGRGMPNAAGTAMAPAATPSTEGCGDGMAEGDSDASACCDDRAGHDGSPFG